MQLIITLVGLALLMIFFSLNTKNFLSQRNLLNIALQTSVAVLLAIAETFVIITGGIDLSIGSISAASGMIVAVCLNQGVSVPIAVSLGLLTGIALGAFNGFTVTVLGIVPFIATLGTNSIMRGLIYVILNGIPLSASSAGEAFTWIGQSKLGGWLPYPVLFMIIIATVAVIVLAKSRFGRTIFAIGSNENAAFLSGIKVKMTKFKVYIFFVDFYPLLQELFLPPELPLLLQQLVREMKLLLLQQLSSEEPAFPVEKAICLAPL